MEKLNVNPNLLAPVTEEIEEIRAYFNFGCGFAYEADHKGIFTLQEHTEAYENSHLHPEIDLQAVIGLDGVREIAAQKVVLFPHERTLNELEKKLESLFDAHSMILIPINDQHGKLIALVGLVDRRGVHRHQDADMEFAYALLASVANRIKLRLYQIRIESTQKSLESILNHMGVDIYVNDFLTHEILYANQSMAAPYGGIDALVGQVCWQALYNDKTEQCDYCPQRKLLDERGAPTKLYSWDYQRPFDGAWFRVLSAAFQWVDGRLAHVVSSVDITENKNNEALIRQLADYDMLTGLPNRRKLLDDSQAFMARCKETGQRGYALFFDLDGFKRINDEMGHRAGDDLLHEIGTFLINEPGFAGRGYRHGGDEFVVLAFDVGFSALCEMVSLLLKRFSKPWHTSDGDALCNTSIGIARYDGDERVTSSDLLHVADKAMYAAKRAGSGQVRIAHDAAYLTLDAYEKKAECL